MMTYTFFVVCCLFVKLVHSVPSSLKSASFINSFEQILLTFDGDVRPTQPYRNCSNIVDKNTLTLLGTTPTCFVTSSTTSTIIPAVDAKIRADDEISLNDVNFASSKATLTANKNGASPLKLVLKGPRTYCTCKDKFLYFNVHMSTPSSYGKIAVASWDIKINKDPIDIDIEDIDGDGSGKTSSVSKIKRKPPPIEFPLPIVIPTQPPTTTLNTTATPPVPTKPGPLTFRSAVRRQRDALDIKLNSSLLDNNGSYTLSVSAKNAFGKSTKVVKTLEFINNCTISLDIHRGSHWYKHETIIFHADVIYPSCWTGLRNATFKMTLGTASGPLPPTEMFTYSNGAPTWVARPNTFTPGQNYMLKVQIELDSTELELIPNPKVARFSVTSQPVGITMLGDYMEGSFASKFVNSYGVVNAISKCTDENGVGCVDGKNIGKTHTYERTLTTGDETVQDSIDIKFLDTPMPTLSVYPSKKSYSPEDEILFSANIAGGSVNGNMTYMWKCYDKYDGNEADMIPPGVIRSGTVILPSNRKNDQYRVITLQLPGNQILFGIVIACKCQLSYEGDTVTAIGSAMMEIPLLNTVLDVVPATGEMIKTAFRAQARGWTGYESNKPLLFRFGYKINQMSRVRYLSPWTSKNSIDNFTFPLMDDKINSIDVLLLVEVLNAKKTISSLNQSITLFKPNPKPMKMPDTKFYLTLDQFKAVQYLYNLLSLSKDIPALAEKPAHEINLNIEEYLDFFLSSPVVWSGVVNVVELLSYFVELAEGKVESGVLGRMNDVIDYIGNETKVYEAHDYMRQSRAIITMINNIVRDEKSKMTINIHHVNKLLPTFIARACDMTLQIDTNSNTTFYIDTPLIDVSAYRDNQISTTPSPTVLNFTEDMVSKFSKQYCNPGKGCDTFCFTDLRYDMKLLVNNAEENGTYLTDFYDVRMWKVGVFARGDVVERVIKGGTSDQGLYEVTLPVTQTGVVFKENDEIQCVIKDATTGEFLPDKCEVAFTCNSFRCPQPKQVHCKCSELGFIAGVKPWKPPPVPGPDLNISIHFWEKPDRCTKRLYPAFKSKFIAALTKDINSREKRINPNGIMQMKKKRTKVGKCKPAQIYNKDLIIIVNFRIIDDIEGLRNTRIKKLLTELIVAQMFKVKMAKVSVPMFDPNQTTPKPKPPTIPPIGEVGVSWMPIIIAIVVIFVFFILLAILSCVYHTYLLKKEVFNEMNSNKPEEKDEDELEQEEAEKAKQEVMTNIMDDVIHAGDRHTNRAHKISHWRMRYSKHPIQVHPINDGNSQNSSAKHSSSDYYHESAQLDRLALDDSSDEEGSRPSSSRAELFQSQSIKAQIEEEGSTITQVEI